MTDPEENCTMQGEIPPTWQMIGQFALPSSPGNERLAMERVAEVVKDQGLSVARLERLKTGVAEATMNAMEHGNHYQAELAATLQVFRRPEGLVVRVQDESGGRPIPKQDEPDLEAKLAGLQTPRGWGLFLIRSMVDEVNTFTDAQHHIIELRMNWKET